MKGYKVLTLLLTSLLLIIMAACSGSQLDLSKGNDSSSAKFVPFVADYGVDIFVDKVDGKNCSDTTRIVVGVESEKFREDTKSKMKHILGNFDGTYWRRFSTSSWLKMKRTNQLSTSSVVKVLLLWSSFSESRWKTKSKYCAANQSNANMTQLLGNSCIH